jgi:uncharacterized protein
MTDYRQKSYGRNEEVDDLYKMFEAGRDISMHGPRRLGKTFLLDRLIDASPNKKWTAVKAELSGCTDTRAVFRELCSRIGTQRSGGTTVIGWFKQRLSQLAGHRSELGGPWYQALTSTDHESDFERLVAAMNDDTERRWLLLIDELPIFLKALHDKGSEGITAACAFMNLLSRLRQQNPKVRWMITGSIGIDPLARIGNYLGVLAKFQPFELHPLSERQAKDYVQDQATTGHLPHRNQITDDEARAIVAAVGWRAAFYLDALAQKLKGAPTTTLEQSQKAVDEAVNQLLQPSEMATFGPSEEHLRKHYTGADGPLAFSVMAALAADPRGTNLDGLLSALQHPALTRPVLHALLIRLHTEGFITVDSWEVDSPHCTFRNPLLRRWWQRFKPQAAV